MSETSPWSSPANAISGTNLTQARQKRNISIRPNFPARITPTNRDRTTVPNDRLSLLTTNVRRHRCALRDVRSSKGTILKKINTPLSLSLRITSAVILLTIFGVTRSMAARPLKKPADAASHSHGAPAQSAKDEPQLTKNPSAIIAMLSRTPVLRQASEFSLPASFSNISYSDGVHALNEMSLVFIPAGANGLDAIGYCAFMRYLITHYTTGPY